tara:strand:- start:1492 stop:2040 length:549 start_codon:yes stop_codon:yes gene_type:complete
MTQFLEDMDNFWARDWNIQKDYENNKLKTIDMQKENNKLIEDYMGEFSTGIPYHTSWDWLMSVIEKLEAEWTQDGFFEFRIHADRTVIVSSQDFYELLHQDGGNKLENTYGAVIEFIEHYNFNSKSKKTYPFNEGDDYWTIENNEIVWSCWDEMSEEMYDENPNTKLFTSKEKAIEYLTKNK